MNAQACRDCGRAMTECRAQHGHWRRNCPHTRNKAEITIDPDLSTKSYADEAKKKANQQISQVLLETGQAIKQLGKVMRDTSSSTAGPSVRLQTVVEKQMPDQAQKTEKGVVTPRLATVLPTRICETGVGSEETGGSTKEGERQ